jgi:exodeoxyribonuclease V alpha subunit
MYLIGNIARQIFRKQDSDFAILLFETTEDSPEPSEQKIIIGDVLREFTAQDRLRVYGDPEVSEKYGPQFRIESVMRELRDPNDFRAFMINNVAGIGPRRAGLLIARFSGDGELAHVMEQQPERLLEIKGVSQSLAERMSESWIENAPNMQLANLLDQIGIGTVRTRQIQRAFGDNAVQVIKDNPYRLMEVYGIAFKKADAAAKRLGVDEASPSRAKAVLSYLLEKAATEGHVYLARGAVLLSATEECGVEPPFAAQALDEVLADETPRGGASLVQYMANSTMGKLPVIYLRRMFQAEKKLAANLRRLIEGAPFRKFEMTRIDASIARAEKALKLALNDGQKEAVRTALTTSLSVLTGAPGSGKTTALRVLVWVAGDLNLRFLLGAPTGRAAKRMTEVTGAPAGTLHRMLLYDVVKHAFTKDRHDPLDCDMVVLDEVSMLDLALSDSTMDAIPTGCSVVLVGDPNQLPSVGAGRVLDDIIQSGRVPVTRLTEIFRQAQKSLIINNANKVLGGEIPRFFVDPPGRTGPPVYDCYHIEPRTTRVVETGRKKDVVDPEWCKAMVTRLVSETIPQRLGLDPIRDVQVLVPQKKGACGVFAMNRYLQQALNPQPPERTVEVGIYEYRYGDRVMVTANKYKLDVFNGDIGFIVKFDREDKQFVIDFDGKQVVYPFDDARHLQPAYATTIHKAQGSEYKAVVAVVLKEHFMMLKRNLLFTAMTRARELLVFVAQRAALEIAVERNDVEARNSLLSMRLRIQKLPQPALGAKGVAA